MSLRDVTVFINTENEIDVPDVEDAEDLPFKISPSLMDGSPLPGWIKYSN
jgi:hypothetical protein